MATKKSPRKKKKSTSRRNIVFLIIATALGTLIVWASVNASRQQQLEREDQEKFAVLESDMDKLKSRLDATANAGEWKLDKYCEKPGIKFYTGEAGSCKILISLAGASNLTVEDVTELLNSFGRTQPLFYSEYANANFINFSLGVEGVVCTLSFDNNASDLVFNPLFSCHGNSMKMYYPER